MGLLLLFRKGSPRRPPLLRLSGHKPFRPLDAAIWSGLGLPKEAADAHDAWCLGGAKGKRRAWELMPSPAQQTHYVQRKEYENNTTMLETGTT